MEITELRTKMAAAIAANDILAIETIAGEIIKGKTERHKADVLAAQAESVALAGEREKLAASIWKSVHKIEGLAEKLATVKASGFTFKLDGTPPGIEYKSVALTVPVVGKVSTGRTGSTGKSKDEFGLSLTQIFDSFANEDDKAVLVEAEAKDAQVKVDTGKSNGVNVYNVKLKVKTRALTEGLIAPTK